MTEHASSRKLRTALQKYEGIYQWKINDRFTRGIPDLFVEGATGEMWVESKHLKELPKRMDTLINIGELLSAHQRDWLRRRWDRHGDALVLISSPQGWLICHNPSMWEGTITTEIFRTCCAPLTKVASYIHENCCNP